MATSLSIEIGLEHHQSGNLPQAEQIYRSILQQYPDNHDAWNLLGILAHQVGQGDVAIACITQALKLMPHNPDFHNNLGEAYRKLGRLDEAVASYDQAIQIKPDFAGAHYNLANAQQARNQIDDAIASYRRALQFNPDAAQAYNNLGILLNQQGKLDEAIAAYQKAVKLHPEYAVAFNNLGTALEEKGELQAAISAYQQAIQFKPDFEAAYNNLGSGLQKIDRLEAAIAALRQSIALKADFAEAHFNLGNALKTKGDFEQAAHSYQRAILINHNWVAAYLARGNALQNQGKAREALSTYQQALQLDFDNSEAFWSQQLTLPVLYDSKAEILEWRHLFAQGLQNLQSQLDLVTSAGKLKALKGINCSTSFYLQYQGLDDTALQKQYGQIVHAVMAANYPQWTAKGGSKCDQLPTVAASSQQASSKPRIGYISGYFREHTVSKLFSGWLRHSDRSEFDIYCYYTEKHSDAVTEMFRQCSHAFHHIPHDFEAVCQQIAADRLDILVFTDIGMFADLTKIAALRLAPVQCVAWGHPVTTGLPTIDYYLTSELMEPEGAEAHYTEKLIRLPNIGIAYAKPTIPTVLKSRQDFGLRDDAVVYFSCQSLYKYLPQYDYMFAEIARRVPQAQFAFLASLNSEYVTQKFQQRLQIAFAELGLDSQKHCLILPRLSWEDYLNLNLVADVFLDTIGWSGGNTTLEAIACNLPVVTLPGKFMRGRHAYAMLRVLAVTDTIATDEADYIEIAAKLGLDNSYRWQIKSELQQNQDRLFEDKTAIRALEDFYRKICQSAKSNPVKEQS